MVTQELRDYVARCKNIGWSDDGIQASLVSNGWKVEDVDSVLLESAIGSVPKPLGLPLVSYRKHLGPLLQLSLGYVIPVIILQLVSRQLRTSATMDSLVVISYSVLAVIATIVELWFALSLVFYVANSANGISIAMQKARKRFFSYLWVVILVMLIIWFGYLLVFIPAIVFAVWFSFSAFVLAQEDARGMNALLKSKEYVKGNWWRVFGMLLALGAGFIAIVIVSALIYAASNASIMPVVAVAVLGLALFFYCPFVVVTFGNLFIQIKNQKGVMAVPKTGRGLFTTFAILGLLMPIVLGALIFSAIRYAHTHSDSTSTSSQNQSTFPYPENQKDPSGPIIQQQ